MCQEESEQLVFEFIKCKDLRDYREILLTVHLLFPYAYWVQVN